MIGIREDLNANVLLLIDTTITIIVCEVTHLRFDLAAIRFDPSHHQTRSPVVPPEIGNAWQGLLTTGEKIGRKQDEAHSSYVDLSRHVLIFVRCEGINQEHRYESFILRVPSEYQAGWKHNGSSPMKGKK